MNDSASTVDYHPGESPVLAGQGSPQGGHRVARHLFDDGRPKAHAIHRPEWRPVDDAGRFDRRVVVTAALGNGSSSLQRKGAATPTHAGMRGSFRGAASPHGGSAAGYGNDGLAMPQAHVASTRIGSLADDIGPTGVRKRTTADSTVRVGGVLLSGPRPTPGRTPGRQAPPAPSTWASPGPRAPVTPGAHMTSRNLFQPTVQPTPFWRRIIG